MRNLPPEKLLVHLYEERISRLVKSAAEALLAAPVQGEVLLFGREAVVTKKVHVEDPARADVVFYFKDEIPRSYFWPFYHPEQAPRYRFRDLPRLAREALREISGGRKWFVQLGGTTPNGKQRNKALYNRAHFESSVLEQRAKEMKAHVPTKKKIKVLGPDGVLREIEINTPGPAPESVQNLRKKWR